jgi:hypothetical protein
LEQLTLWFSQYGFYLWLALVVLALALIVWLAMVQVRLNRLLRQYRTVFAGAQGGNLEALLGQNLEEGRRTSARVEELTALCQRLETTLQHAVQGVGIVRFNPFGDTGGDQSFAVALLDAQGDGLVLTSLYGRAESRIYAKPVQGGQSPYPLTAEETQAIQQARESRS